MTGVTNPAGTVRGHLLTGLTDGGCYGFSGWTSPPAPGDPAQWQHLGPLMSNLDGVCARLGSGGSYGKTPDGQGEITLRMVLLGVSGTSAPVYPPAGDLPLTFTANQQTVTSDGVQRYCKPYVMQASKNGNPGSDTAATGGTVTYTRIDAAGAAGSWDLTFSGDHTTGSFDCAWCGTPP